VWSSGSFLGFAMPFIASILPWWVWLLLALALASASWLFFELYRGAKYLTYSSRSTWVWEWTLGAVFLVAALLCATIAFVGLVKWAWPR